MHTAILPRGKEKPFHSRLTLRTSHASFGGKHTHTHTVTGKHSDGNLTLCKNDREKNKRQKNKASHTSSQNSVFSIHICLIFISPSYSYSLCYIHIHGHTKFTMPQPNLYPPICRFSEAAGTLTYYVFLSFPSFFVSFFSLIS